MHDKVGKYNLFCPAAKYVTYFPSLIDFWTGINSNGISDALIWVFFNSHFPIQSHYVDLEPSCLNQPQPIKKSKKERPKSTTVQNYLY